VATTRPPSVEERLMWAEQNLALLARLAHAEALALGADQDLGTRHQFAASSSWCLMRLSEEAHAHIEAIGRALGPSPASPRQIPRRPRSLMADKNSEHKLLKVLNAGVRQIAAFARERFGAVGRGMVLIMLPADVAGGAVPSIEVGVMIYQTIEEVRRDMRAMGRSPSLVAGKRPHPAATRNLRSDAAHDCDGGD